MTAGPVVVGVTISPFRDEESTVLRLGQLIASGSHGGPQLVRVCCAVLCFALCDEAIVVEGVLSDLRLRGEEDSWRGRGLWMGDMASPAEV